MQNNVKYETKVIFCLVVWVKGYIFAIVKQEQQDNERATKLQHEDD